MKVVSCCLDRLPRELKGEIMTLLIYADVANWAEATRDPVVAAVATHRWQCVDKMLKAHSTCGGFSRVCCFPGPFHTLRLGLKAPKWKFKWPENKKDEDRMMATTPVQIAKSRTIKSGKFVYLQHYGDPPNEYMFSLCTTPETGS